MAYLDDKLGRGERIVHHGHQHFIVIALNAVKWVIFFAASFILILVLGILWQPVAGDWTATLKNVVMLGLTACCLIAFVALLIAFFVWRAEDYVITNERVIKVWGILNKNMSDSSLDKINDVELTQTLFGRMMGYGTIKVLTGNEGGANIYDYLSNPNDFKKAMLDAKNGFFGDANEVARKLWQQQEAAVMPPPQQPYPPVQSSVQMRQPEQQMPYMQEQYVPKGLEYGQPQPGPNAADIPGMIAQLAKLRDAGAITEEEFQIKKNDLLRRL